MGWLHGRDHGLRMDHWPMDGWLNELDHGLGMDALANG